MGWDFWFSAPISAAKTSCGSLEKLQLTMTRSPDSVNCDGLLNNPPSTICDFAIMLVRDFAKSFARDRFMPGLIT